MLSQYSREFTKNTGSQALAALLTHDLRERGPGICTKPARSASRFGNHCAGTPGCPPTHFSRKDQKAASLPRPMDIAASAFPPSEDPAATNVPDLPPWPLLGILRALGSPSPPMSGCCKREEEPGETRGGQAGRGRPEFVGALPWHRCFPPRISHQHPFIGHLQCARPWRAAKRKTALPYRTLPV